MCGNFRVFGKTQEIFMQLTEKSTLASRRVSMLILFLMLAVGFINCHEQFRPETQLQNTKEKVCSAVMLVLREEKMPFFFLILGRA